MNKTIRYFPRFFLLVFWKLRCKLETNSRGLFFWMKNKEPKVLLLRLFFLAEPPQKHMFFVHQKQGFFLEFFFVESSLPVLSSLFYK